MGDLFDNRKAQKLSVLSSMKKILKNCPMMIIPGNHDKYDQSDRSSYIDMYDNVANVIDDGHFVEVNGGKILLCFMPFFTNDVYIEKLEKLKQNINDSYKKVFLFTHIAINGVRNNDGSLVDNGIKLSMFTEFDHVFVGHYHNKSKVGKNITYIGSAFQSNYGEDNNKGFTLLYEDGSTTFIKSKFPEYVVYKLDVDEIEPHDLPKVCDDLIEKRTGMDDGNVRVLFVGKETTLQQIDDKLLRKNKIDVRFLPKELLSGIESAEQEEFVNFNSQLSAEWLTYGRITNLSKLQVSKGIEILNSLSTANV